MTSKLCRNSLCPIDYPHNHERSTLDGLPASWGPSIDDPAVRSPWPERLQWERPNRREHYHGIFKYGWFGSHSGFQLPWKFDCERFTEDDWESLAAIVAGKFAFSSVYGIPRGGVLFARALDRYCEPGYPTLIVDDVLTTGRSFIHARATLGNPEKVFGVVVLARGKVPDWVWPILSVNEWAQSRGTGLG